MKEKKLEQQKVIAETLNGRLAMLGLVAAATSDLLTGHMFFGILMHELSQINEISPFQAILWCFYPVGFVVLLDLVLRTNDNDDDDDEGGGVMSPVYQGT